MSDHKLLERPILLSRLLTRSGDQAWNFAVPIVLIQLFAKNPQPALIYFFVVLLCGILLTPHVGRFIDSMPRFRLIKLGITIQAISITLSLLVVAGMHAYGIGDMQPLSFGVIQSLGLLVICGLGANIGSTIMDISVASDMVPTVISKDRMGPFNSKFRQVDLLTEVTSPLVAGLLLTLTPESYWLLGFTIVWLWNLMSFAPEYFLLRSVFRLSPELQEPKRKDLSLAHESIWKKLISGLPEFRRQNIFIAMIAYSILWVSVLSPHGVLLTAFLKNGWKLPEVLIGGFRGLGALFGLVATLLYPKVLAKFGLLKTSRMFLLVQLMAVVLAVSAFHFDALPAHILFLIFILFSRIGLYGFSLGEGQMRQICIAEAFRGRVNGAASAMNSVATLMLFGFGAIFSEPRFFFILVYLSGFAVLTAATLLCFWRPHIPELEETVVPA
ncbi:MAG: ABC transporter substrate-binding protein [Oligoflexus sp.]|nr:ABC transporter substrate-binding protein [Oligoflexus sp.]